MALKYSTRVRDAMNDAMETTIGNAPILRVYSGTEPANCAAALSGNTLLAEGTLPSDWLTASASGLKQRNGTWTLTGQSGAGTGTAGTFFRIWNAAGTICDHQGSFGGTGSGADMVADNASIANGQAITVNTYSITRGNA
jgi:hypothetical protein